MNKNKANLLIFDKCQMETRSSSKEAELIQLVMDQADVSRKEAVSALNKNKWDLVEAILDAISSQYEEGHIFDIDKEKEQKSFEDTDLTPISVSHKVATQPHRRYRDPSSGNNTSKEFHEFVSQNFDKVCVWTALDPIDHLASKVEGSVKHFLHSTSNRVSDSMKRKTQNRIDLAKKTVLNMKPGQRRKLQLRNDYEVAKVIEFLKECTIDYLQYEVGDSDQKQKVVESIESKDGSNAICYGGAGCPICGPRLRYHTKEVPIKLISVYRSVKPVQKNED